VGTRRKLDLAGARGFVSVPLLRDTAVPTLFDDEVMALARRRAIPSSGGSRTRVGVTRRELATGPRRAEAGHAGDERSHPADEDGPAKHRGPEATRALERHGADDAAEQRASESSRDGADPEGPPRSSRELLVGRGWAPHDALPRAVAGPTRSAPHERTDLIPSKCTGVIPPRRRPSVSFPGAPRPNLLLVRRPALRPARGRPEATS
jgi:hypothetical protein